MFYPTSPFHCDSLHQSLPDYTEVIPSELQRIVLHYFFNEQWNHPDNYLTEIIREITRRDPSPYERHYVCHFDNWLRKYYTVLDTYIIELIIVNGYDPSEMEPSEIIRDFEKEYHICLEPEDAWKRIVKQILQDFDQLL